MFARQRLQWWSTLLRVDVRLWQHEINNASFNGGIAMSSTLPGPSPLQQLPAVLSKDEDTDPSTTAPVRDRVARAVSRQLHTSVKKLTPVAKLVRKMRVEDALLQCDLVHKKGAWMVQNAIRSARANGVHNHGLDPSKLFVEYCYATNGRSLKRIKIHGKGKFGRMKKRRTHLTVILREDESPRPRPHIIQQTWLQRQMDREQGIQKDASLQKQRDRKLASVRLKWKTQLRRMRMDNKRERAKAKRESRMLETIDETEKRTFQSSKNNKHTDSGKEHEEDVDEGMSVPSAGERNVQ